MTLPTSLNFKLVTAVLLFIVLIASTFMLRPTQQKLSFPPQPYPQTCAPSSQSASPPKASSFAYIEYATNLEYLCNAVMTFESLQRLGCSGSRVLLHPSDISPDDNSTEGYLLQKVSNDYGVELKAIEVQSRKGVDGNIKSIEYTSSLT